MSWVDVYSSQNKEVVDSNEEVGFGNYELNFGTNMSQEIESYIIKSYRYV